MLEAIKKLLGLGGGTEQVPVVEETMTTQQEPVATVEETTPVATPETDEPATHDTPTTEETPLNQQM